MKRVKSYIDIIMNPTGNRIIQYLVSHTQSTTSEIAVQLKDVSKATLYRHISILEKNKVLLVIEEHKIRGTTEKVYTLNQDLINRTGDAINAKTNIWNLALNLYKDFDVYFSKPDAKPIADRIFFDSVSLSLSDGEFDRLTAEMQDVIERYRAIAPAKHSRSRKLTIISSPGNKKF